MLWVLFDKLSVKFYFETRIRLPEISGNKCPVKAEVEEPEEESARSGRDSVRVMLGSGQRHVLAVATPERVGSDGRQLFPELLFRLLSDPGYPAHRPFFWDQDPV